MNENVKTPAERLGGNLARYARHKHRDGTPDYEQLAIEFEFQIEAEYSDAMKIVAAAKAYCEANKKMAAADLTRAVPDLAREEYNAAFTAWVDARTALMAACGYEVKSE